MAGALAQQARALGLFASQGNRLALLVGRGYSAAPAAAAEEAVKSTYDVPEGHHGSDLSNTACHIGLGRRRDLTMRQDLALWDGDKKLSLADVFKVCCGARALRCGGRAHLPTGQRPSPRLRQRADGWD